MSAQPIFATLPSITGLQAELDHANRVMKTSLRELRESRQLIDRQEAELIKRATVISEQKVEMLEWMHAAAAHKLMAENLLASPSSQEPPQSGLDQLANCVLLSAKSDARYRYTALLVMALERLAENPTTS